MAKNWYPMIDFAKCSSCGTCIDFCPHGVYNKEASSPEVIQPEKCIDKCHGCEKRCPEDAISYYGDENDTGESCGCSCGTGCC